VGARLGLVIHGLYAFQPDSLLSPLLFERLNKLRQGPTAGRAPVSELDEIKPNFAQLIGGNVCLWNSEQSSHVTLPLTAACLPQQVAENRVFRGLD
jgi:hypothetical protein